MPRDAMPNTSFEELPSYWRRAFRAQKRDLSIAQFHREKATKDAIKYRRQRNELRTELEALRAEIGQ